MLTQAKAILALVSTLVGTKVSNVHPAYVRAETALDSVEIALRQEGLEGPELEAWALRLWGWSYWESSWYPSPPGDNDGGRACGVLQVHEPGALLPGATCAAVRKDLVLGYRVGYRALRKFVTLCGSIDAGLGAYATGMCRSNMNLVRKRCIALGDKACSGS